MNGKYLLDSNIVIALFSGEPAVLQALGRAHEVFVPAIVVGELYYGAHKSARREANIARVGNFVDAVAILNCGHETARKYGEIKQQLNATGRPIPENDIWIAATALEYGLTLASRDKHFEGVAELERVHW